jgi:hypothetical protein
LRTLSRVHRSQRYSMPRSPVCTVHVTGGGAALVPHHEQVTVGSGASGTMSV